ncbi:hypothetical protein CAEBREN_20590 [Caenorhabditis brenneri]|uniref:F-box domain-containing protein n=1 Tax=Caenorhabditis brenneri TaxID=135651 RepID=G0NCH2_CAEBE|nr:hypothetical protein CAEBREN_20590 [Caenorhabditis brenneri]
MSSINLFGFPIVVLRNVFSQFGPAEIFTISLCSKRTEQNLQYVMRPNTVVLHLTASDENEFTIECSRGRQCLTFRGSSESVDEYEYVVNTNAGSVPVSFSDKTVFVNCKKRVFKAFFKYICNIFRSEIGKLFLWSMTPSSQVPIWVIEWVMCQQESLKSLWILADEVSKENISYIVSKANITEELNLVSNYYKSNANIRMRPMSLRKFESFNSAWFTLENLINLDVETAKVYSTQLTSRNMFLRHWVYGGCGRLLEMYLEFGLRMIVDFNQVLDGIDFKRVEQKKADKYFSEYLSGFVGKDGGFKVRRKSDGKVALLLNNRQKPSFFNLLVDC